MLKSLQEVKVSYKLLSQKNSTVMLNPCPPVGFEKINFVLLKLAPIPLKLGTLAQHH